MIICEIPYTEEYVEASYGQPKYDSLQLGSLRSYNINILVKVEKSDKHSKGMTTLTLREVPKFLVDAFIIIRSNIEKEGLFRKGGNTARVNTFCKKLSAIYAGREIIPSELNYLDVCSLIKTFIKTLKIPLLYNHDLTNKLLELAKRKEAGKKINGDDVQELFQPRSLMHKEVIPKAHIGTLGFLMRELYRVSQHSEKNGMTVQNLAMIFGPTLFDMAFAGLEREKAAWKSVGPMRVPNKTGSMDEARQTSQRAATAVAILIERATWIGLHRECYVSSQARSSSAAPLQRTSQSRMCPVISNRSSQLTTRRDPTMIKQQGDVPVREETSDRGFGSAVKNCARRSLGYLALMSPLPGRRTARPFLGRHKSSDTLASDEDHRPVVQMSTNQKGLNDFNRKTRHSSNLMVKREVKTVDKKSESLAKVRSAMVPKLSCNSISVPSENSDFLTRQSTSSTPRAADLNMPTRYDLNSKVIQSIHKSPIKSTIVSQLNFDTTRDSTILGTSTRCPIFLPCLPTAERSYLSSFIDHNPKIFDSSPESPIKATVISRLNLDPNQAYGNFSRKTATLSPEIAPCPTKRLSARMHDRRHFVSPTKTISPRGSADEFEHDDRNRNAIVAASSGSELDVGEASDQRPSVVFITEKLGGLVRGRVDQFGGGNLSIVASPGRPSTLSNASKPFSASEF